MEMKFVYLVSAGILLVFLISLVQCQDGASTTAADATTAATAEAGPEEVMQNDQAVVTTPEPTPAPTAAETTASTTMGTPTKVTTVAGETSSHPPLQHHGDSSNKTDHGGNKKSAGQVAGHNFVLLVPAAIILITARF